MKCDVIRKRGKLIIRFKKEGGEMKKSVICRIRNMVSRHYVTPGVLEHSDGIDLVVVPENSTTLDSVSGFVKNILLPHIQNAQNSCSCKKCNTKKRPSFCTHKKAVA